MHAEDAGQLPTASYLNSGKPREQMTAAGRVFAQTVLDRGLTSFVAGELRRGRGAPFDVIDPSSGESLGRVPGASSEQLDEAVVIARAAFSNTQWSRDPALRADLLRKLGRVSK